MTSIPLPVWVAVGFVAFSVTTAVVFGKAAATPEAPPARTEQEAQA